MLSLENIFKERAMAFSLLLDKNGGKMQGFEQPWDPMMEARHLGWWNSKFEEAHSLLIVEPPKQPLTLTLFR